MTKKYILFSLVLGTLLSEAEARNFLGNWETFQTLKAKAADPTVEDQDVIDAFKAYQAYNNANIAAALTKFNAANEPLVNFQVNYNPLQIYYNNGGAPNNAAQQALQTASACVQGKLNNQGAKWMFFQNTSTFLSNTPDDRGQISAKLATLDQNFSSCSLNPSTNYTYDPVAQVGDYTQAYKTQKYTAYVQAAQITASSDQLKIFTPLQTSTLTTIGTPVSTVEDQLKSTDACVSSFLLTRKDKWKGLAGENSYVPGDSISPALPL